MRLLRTAVLLLAATAGCSSGPHSQQQPYNKEENNPPVNREEQPVVQTGYDFKDAKSGMGSKSPWPNQPQFPEPESDFRNYDRTLPITDGPKAGLKPEPVPNSVTANGNPASTSYGNEVHRDNGVGLANEGQ